MKDLEKIKEFFLKDRAMTAAYEAKESKEEDVLGDWISDMLKYKSYEEVKRILLNNLRDALMDDELVAKIKKEKGINEAQEEDKVDTITMDIPLFLRMLEYSREDAQKDLDLHDVTEKANKLGKERGILSMEDYEEIVGAAEDAPKEDMNEGMGGQLDEPYFIEVSVRDARKALDMFDDMYRRSNIKMYGSNVYAANTPEDIYDLYYDLNNQGIEILDYNVEGDLDEATDYMKRRKAMDDYAVSKKDKPAKSYNPKPSGKTDYMKRREKDLEERISEALDSINEELCPAGKAYIKRRKAAGEKSSAYLSGRAVKVCKGQMSGKSKKK